MLLQQLSYNGDHVIVLSRTKYENLCLKVNAEFGALGEQPARLCAMMHHRNLTVSRHLFAKAT